uniref:WH2 domain-containing protein n=1 Tax=Caenorhabditis tropicalis TaxID=1561998 RepID=A0A1I7UNZ6_9PELO
MKRTLKERKDRNRVHVNPEDIPPPPTLNLRVAVPLTSPLGISKGLMVPVHEKENKCSVPPSSDPSSRETIPPPKPPRSWFPPADQRTDKQRLTAIRLDSNAKFRRIDQANK